MLMDKKTLTRKLDSKEKSQNIEKITIIIRDYCIRFRFIGKQKCADRFFFFVVV